MTSFLNSVNSEIDYLTNLQDQLAKDPVDMKKYVISTRHIKNGVYYVNVSNVDGKRKCEYLGDAGSERLHELARCSYKSELMRRVKHDLKVLKKVLLEFREYDRVSVLGALSPCLSNVGFEADFDVTSKALRKWMKKEYRRNTKEFKGGVIKTEDGRRVRSKSECIIYNMLLRAGIPFWYDAVIELKKKNEMGALESFYEAPDFLIKCPDGTLIIIEHAGLLTSSQYAYDLAKRLQIYQVNGFFMGYSLFVTSDTADGGIDSKEISRVIDCIKTHFPYL